MQQYNVLLPCHNTNACRCNLQHYLQPCVLLRPMRCVQVSVHDLDRAIDDSFTSAGDPRVQLVQVAGLGSRRLLPAYKLIVYPKGRLDSYPHVSCRSWVLHCRVRHGGCHNEGLIRLDKKGALYAQGM